MKSAKAGMQKVQLTKWARELVAVFGKEYNELASGIREQIPKFENLSRYTQIEIIWIEDKRFQVDLQLLVFTCGSRRKKINVAVHRIADVSHLHNALEEMSVSQSWNEEHRARLDSQFTSVFHSLKTRVAALLFTRNSLRPAVSIKGSISDKSSYWICSGRIQDLDIKDIVDAIISAARRTALSKLHKKQQPTKKILKGFGVYCYPPIWIGDVPQISFQDKILPPLMLKYLDRQFHFRYKGRILTVSRDGYFAISEEERETALELLNEIMAVGYFLGLQIHIVRDPSICRVQIDQQNPRVVMWEVPYDPARMRLFERTWQEYSPEMISYNYHPITEEKIAEIVREAEKITKSDEVTNYLKYLLESHTHYSNSEYSQSFIMSWTIVERHISGFWDHMIERRIHERKRIAKLKNVQAWTTDHQVEFLNLIGKINNDNYSLVRRLKSVRNGIVHKGKKCSREDAIECLQLSHTIVARMIRKKNEDIENSQA